MLAVGAVADLIAQNWVSGAGLSAEKFSSIMTEATKRSIARWIHIVFGIPIIGYVYSPFSDLPDYAPVVRYVALPVIALTGLWMWKGHLLRRMMSK